MLGWLTGAQRAEYAEDSKLLEPPETPAPVFALRAFKSVIFGTPRNDEDDEDNNAPSHKDGLNYSQYAPVTTDTEVGAPKSSDEIIVNKRQALLSPTKSILVTPGGGVSRRKTVSFGATVVDNERKNPIPEASKSGLPQDYPGKFPSPWPTKRSESRDGRQSKFTQTLLEVRGNKESEEGNGTALSAKDFDIFAEKVKHTKQDTPKRAANETDEMINLDEPRSQSGQYWKLEYENYRTKTNREIRKLLQYRHVAKSYARKKDTEAMRLAEKLKQEEGKVVKMEQKVSELAAGMVGSVNSGKKDGEQVIADLVKQTALTLQYKERVDQLRETLESHGVLEDSAMERAAEKSTSEASAKKLHKTEQELADANTKLKEMTAQKSEMKKLQDLVRSTEQKASDRDRENQTLKNSLVRFKSEMSQYEDRRKAKEERLKQREAKLEGRNQEYKDRLENASRERHEGEEALKKAFDEERKKLRQHIQLLQNSASYDGKHIHESQRRRGSQKLNMAMEEDRYNDQEDLDQLPHIYDRSPRIAHENSRRPPKQVNPQKAELPLVDIWTAIDGNTNAEQDGFSAISPHQQLLADVEDTEDSFLVQESNRQFPNTIQVPPTVSVLPSSPPRLPSPDPTLSSITNVPRARIMPSPRPSMISFASSPPKPEAHRRATTSKTMPPPPLPKHRIGSTLNRSILPNSSRTSSMASKGAANLPPDRAAAAKARLRQKSEEKKRTKGEGKENVEDSEILARS